MRSNLSRILITLVAIPALVSLAVSLLVLSVWGAGASSGQPAIILPTYSATSMLPPRSSETANNAGGSESASTLTGDSGTPASSDAPCENPVHAVQPGETLSVIAESFGISMDDITAMNSQLDPAFDPDFLSIGQELIIPLCGVPEPPPTDQPTFTPVATRHIPTPIATATEPPAGTTAIMITGVLHPGDVTSEAVELLNQGSPIDLAGWTLSSKRGDGFVFPTFRLFSGGGVVIYTGIGENTPSALYWGLTKAIWRSGDIVSLFDKSGALKTQYTIP
jgi:LysM repeat protein